MIIHGRAIAQEITEQVRKELAGTPCVMRAITVAPNAATQSYLRIKHKAALQAGIMLHVHELPETATLMDFLDVFEEQADAFIVQLPLPPSIDTEAVLAKIPVYKDVDVLSAEAKERKLVVAPVAAAVEEILLRGNVPVQGAHAVVIGRGRLVGAPVAERLTELGAVVHQYDEHDFSPDVLKDAQIVVSGAGVPGLITPSMLTKGVALIDAGTSEQGGAIVGDIDPACVAFASVFTPVPGGVGPITVACLMRNTVELRKVNIGVH